MNDGIIDRLQADVVALLGNVPSLSTVTLLKDQEGDLEDQVQRSLQTVLDPNGKMGLAIIVFAPEVVSAERNLPGPVMDLEIRVQVIEEVIVNQDAGSGTGISAAKGALRVVGALHLTSLGDVVLYAEKNPAKKLKVKDGYVSFMVTIHVFQIGLDPAAKPLGVTASFEASAFPPIILSGTAGPNIDGTIPYAGEINGKPSWSNGLTGAAAVVIQYVGLGDTWYINPVGGGGPVKFQAYKAAGGASTPVGLTGWTITSAGSSGAPVLAEGSSGGTLSLACASPSSTIRYTTDGTFPSPSATLYTTPIPGLATGTVVRAAAYVAGMPPGDVLELTVTA